jgi:predicted dehydrogenase
MIRTILSTVFVLGLSAQINAQNIRAGIIGLDTSHVLSFTKTLNAQPQKPEVMGVHMVAAYAQGSKDIESSTRRVPEYTEKVKAMGVEIVPSLGMLLDKVDVIFLETNDGRPHLEQLRPCLAAHKPVFIDKPIAGTLVDAIKIFDEAKAAGVPLFSSSSLRFGKSTQAVRGGSLGKVSQAETYSPASLEKTHPDLFWYGIHGVESLFTVMGTGCISVKRGTTADGKITVTGTWDGGRKGTFSENKGYGGKAVGEKGESAVGTYDGYDPLLFAAVHFFRTGIAPVSAEETLEIYAFMEAADESKRRNGAEVALKEVMKKALTEARK